jgi:hypothetical protein
MNLPRADGGGARVLYRALGGIGLKRELVLLLQEWRSRLIGTRETGILMVGGRLPCLKPTGIVLATHSTSTQTLYSE